MVIVAVKLPCYNIYLQILTSELHSDNHLESCHKSVRYLFYRTSCELSISIVAYKISIQGGEDS